MRFIPRKYPTDSLGGMLVEQSVECDIGLAQGVVKQSKTLQLMCCNLCAGVRQRIDEFWCVLHPSRGARGNLRIPYGILTPLYYGKALKSAYILVCVFGKSGRVAP